MHSQTFIKLTAKKINYLAVPFFASPKKGDYLFILHNYYFTCHSGAGRNPEDFKNYSFVCSPALQRFARLRCNGFKNLN